eukprot:m.242823 g.242823  ORF g.242823 m.242823 type:complete len:64 (+) comp40228_c0_seq4:1207-1398(+)
MLSCSSAECEPEQLRQCWVNFSLISPVFLRFPQSGMRRRILGSFAVTKAAMDFASHTGSMNTC